MEKLHGYMVTWTTYGTSLQGDEKGYVKDEQVLPPNAELKQANLTAQKQKAVKLNLQQRQLVRVRIMAEAARIGHDILALAVCSNHVHLVAKPCREQIAQVVQRYKNAAWLELRAAGMKHRAWTQGYDKRLCFSEEDLRRQIEYAKQHAK